MARATVRVVKISPRYDGPSILELAAPAGDLSVPLLRQRRRFARTLAGLDDDQWAARSRCDAWAVRDVVAHLASVDGYWALSVASALRGEPTRVLDGFDPATVPEQLVDAARDQSTAEVLAAYEAGVEAFAAVVTGLDAAQWAMPTEAPPGHVPLHVMVRHALWDAWVHERDVLLPLGIPQAIEPDEVRASLEYAAALGPGLLALQGSSRPGVLAVVGTDPDTEVVVELGDVVTVGSGPVPADAVVLRGPTLELLEALSLRAAFPCPVEESDRWMLEGLAVAFDQLPAG
jgi:uncharacterized protein (TIGR03083 family)